MRHDVLYLPTREYEALALYDDYSGKSILKSSIELLSHSLSYGSLAMIDLPLVKDSVNRLFDFLEIRQRYEKLKINSRATLSFDKDGFHLDGHTFYSLDEVERALKNKAFL